MGEEAAGVDATRIALSRILAGQSEITLVGGANNGERKDLLMFFVLGGFALKGDYRPIWERSGDGGFVLGSIGAFLVIEERRHAQARGALPIARLVEVQSGRSARTSGTVTTALRQMWEKFSSRLHSGSHAAISGATGVQSATAEERAFFAEHPEIPVRATGTYLGHGLEPQFPMNIALAALALNRGTLFPPCDSSGVEQAKSGTLTQVLVTSVGHWRGEGMALLDKVG